MPAVLLNIQCRFNQTIDALLILFGYVHPLQAAAHNSVKGLDFNIFFNHDHRVSVQVVVSTICKFFCKGFRRARRKQIDDIFCRICNSIDNIYSICDCIQEIRVWFCVFFLLLRKSPSCPGTGANQSEVMTASWPSLASTDEVSRCNVYREDKAYLDHLGYSVSAYSYCIRPISIRSVSCYRQTQSL